MQHDLWGVGLRCANPTLIPPLTRMVFVSSWINVRATLESCGSSVHHQSRVWVATRPTSIASPPVLPAALAVARGRAALRPARPAPWRWGRVLGVLGRSAALVATHSALPGACLGAARESL